jgi:hypothetical protein
MASRGVARTIFQLNCHRLVGAFHQKSNYTRLVQELVLEKKLSTIQVQRKG